MNRERRVLRYLAEALQLIRAGHRDHLTILGRLDNAVIASSLSRWKDVRDAIGEAEEYFILGNYGAAARTLSLAIARVERRLAEGSAERLREVVSDNGVQPEQSRERCGQSAHIGPREAPPHP